MDVRAENLDVRARKCVFLRPRDGEKLFDPWASGRKGQECPGKSGPKKVYVYAAFLH